MLQSNHWQTEHSSSHCCAQAQKDPATLLQSNTISVSRYLHVDLSATLMFPLQDSLATFFFLLRYFLKSLKWKPVSALWEQQVHTCIHECSQPPVPEPVGHGAYPSQLIPALWLHQCHSASLPWSFAKSVLLPFHPNSSFLSVSVWWLAVTPGSGVKSHDLLHRRQEEKDK